MDCDSEPVVLFEEDVVDSVYVSLGEADPVHVCVGTDIQQVLDHLDDAQVTGRETDHEQVTWNLSLML
jgi:hypothetical protein